MNNKTNVDHWSYSSAKNIYRKGIDYAVGERLGLIEKTFGKSVDIGQLAHAHLLGGQQEFVVSPYKDFRTKEAQEWRDSQELPIINEEEFKTITTIVDRVKSHPLANELIFGNETEREVRVKATIEGKSWVGRADVLKVNKNLEVEYALDVKTTAKFDDFKWESSRNDYDLQSAVYSLIANSKTKPFYWVVAETVAPYRVGIAVASSEFLEKGFSKLEKICSEIKDFDARPGKDDLSKLNFNLNNSMDDLIILGDWSW